jgi:glycosyltransferase A (GT-A) superfamily protein (DUF2064 family)
MARGTQKQADAGPAVLIMARAPRRGEVRRALEPVLGADGCLALQSALLVLTSQWARALGPRSIHVAHDPPDAGPELRKLVGDGIGVFPQNGEGISGRLADATARVFARGPGPVMIIWPDVPRLRPAHAVEALGDLEDGADVVFGPVYGGGFYMIAIARPMPTLFNLPEQVWRGADAVGIGLAACRDGTRDVGILRSERGLCRPSDVRAALADPTLPEFVARALRRR